MLSSQEVEQLIELLNKTSPKLVEASPALQRAVEDWLERGDDAFYRRCASMRNRKRKSKTLRGRLGEASLIHSFYQKRRADRDGDFMRSGSKRRKVDDVENLVKATQLLQTATTIDGRIFGEFWGNDRDLFSVGVDPGMSRQARLTVAQSNCENNSFKGECQRRILLVCMHREVQLSSPPSDEESFPMAMTQFARATMISDSEIEIRRRDAQCYMALARLFGPGVLLMAGTESRSLWRRIARDEIKWVWDYCNDHLQHVIHCATRLNPVAIDIIISGLSLYGASVQEFWCDGTLLSEICKPSGAMHILATTASLAEEVVPAQSSEWFTYGQDSAEPISGASTLWVNECADVDAWSEYILGQDTLVNM